MILQQLKKNGKSDGSNHLLLKLNLPRTERSSTASTCSLTLREVVCMWDTGADTFFLMSIRVSNGLKNITFYIPWVGMHLAFQQKMMPSKKVFNLQKALQATLLILKNNSKTLLRSMIGIKNLIQQILIIINGRNGSFYKCSKQALRMKIMHQLTGALLV